MAAFGNKTYQHSSLIAKKEIEDGLSERINFDNVIYHYDDDFVQNDNHKVMNRVGKPLFGKACKNACPVGFGHLKNVPCLAKMCPSVPV